MQSYRNYFVAAVDGLRHISDLSSMTRGEVELRNELIKGWFRQTKKDLRDFAAITYSRCKRDGVTTIEMTCDCPDAEGDMQITARAVLTNMKSDLHFNENVCAALA